MNDFRVQVVRPEDVFLRKVDRPTDIAFVATVPSEVLIVGAVCGDRTRRVSDVSMIPS